MSDDLVKDALRMIPYGFYAISTRSGDDVNIMVANWLTQASFSPRQVALGLQKTSYSHGLVESSGVFVINIFNKADSDAIRPFTKGRAKNPDKMTNVHFTPAPLTGCPIVDGAAAYLECKVAAKLDTGGDHEIVVAEVIGAGVNKPGEAKDTLTLVDFGWSYAG
jgi:flavin reductase (DIM6/NTAB) family NADH-FMN oxidoreductase RutF